MLSKHTCQPYSACKYSALQGAPERPSSSSGCCCCQAAAPGARPPDPSLCRCAAGPKLKPRCWHCWKGCPRAHAAPAAGAGAAAAAAAAAQACSCLWGRDGGRGSWCACRWGKAAHEAPQLQDLQRARGSGGWSHQLRRAPSLPLQPAAAQTRHCCTRPAAPKVCCCRRIGPRSGHAAQTAARVCVCVCVYQQRP
eukprot:1154393-Pelagomonas_calceolata.AAC.5